MSLLIETLKFNEGTAILTCLIEVGGGADREETTNRSMKHPAIYF